MLPILIALIFGTSIVLAAPEGGIGYGGHGGHHGYAAAPVVADYYAHPKYAYSYGVDDKLTGDHKRAEETRDGGLTKGSYSFLQSDGRLRSVEYISDPVHGFQAKVHYSAPAVHKKVVAVAPVVGYGHAHGGFGHGGHHGAY